MKKQLTWDSIEWKTPMQLADARLLGRINQLERDQQKLVKRKPKKP